MVGRNAGAIWNSASLSARCQGTFETLFLSWTASWALAPVMCEKPSDLYCFFLGNNPRKVVIAHLGNRHVQFSHVLLYPQTLLRFMRKFNRLSYLISLPLIYFSTNWFWNCRLLEIIFELWLLHIIEIKFNGQWRHLNLLPYNQILIMK